MSIVKVDMALALVAEDDGLYVSGPQSDEVLDQVQKILRVGLSEDYLYFLKKCGNLSFGGFEVFGIVSAGIEAPFEANFVRTTLETREYGGPENLYVIGRHELGNPSMKSGEDTVIVHHEGVPESSQNYEVLAPTFGDYLYSSIAQQIEWMKGS